MYKIGQATSTTFNREKTRGPATRLVVLGLLYCSVTQACRIGDKKRDKYLMRVDRMLLSSSTTSIVLEQAVGNLGYAAWVEPFGRPLLTFIAHQIDSSKPSSVILISPLLRIGLLIWRAILTRNRGLPYAYIMDSLPKVKTPIFVDASKSIGLGGFHGSSYFSITHDKLMHVITRCQGWESFPQVRIAWIELLAVLVAMSL